MRAHLTTFARHSRRIANVTGRTLKRGADASLGVVERVLLSRSGRERVHASATFALIFAFAVSSVDFLLTGGFDFGPPAAHAQSTAHASLIAPTQRTPAPIQVAGLAPELAQATEANVTEISQNFDASFREAVSERAPPEPEAPAIFSRTSLAGGAALISISDPAEGIEAPKDEPESAVAASREPKKD